MGLFNTMIRGTQTVKDLSQLFEGTGADPLLISQCQPHQGNKDVLIHCLECIMRKLSATSIINEIGDGKICSNAADICIGRRFTPQGFNHPCVCEPF